MKIEFQSENEKLISEKENSRVGKTNRTDVRYFPKLPGDFVSYLTNEVEQVFGVSLWVYSTGRIVKSLTIV